MGNAPKSHPRYKSLNLRDRIIEGVSLGLTSKPALIAHGRGEAFYYLLGEKTHDFSYHAMKATAACIINAENPVLSVNGNTASLATNEIVSLVNRYPKIAIEVNIFNYSKERSAKIAEHLKNAGAKTVYEAHSPESIVLATIDSNRRMMHPKGIGSSDVVIVALEDGDRCEALVATGKKIISIDLNPLSRSAIKANITIVDELTEVIKQLPDILDEVSKLTRIERDEIIRSYDNKKSLKDAEDAIRKGF